MGGRGYMLLCLPARGGVRRGGRVKGEDIYREVGITGGSLPNMGDQRVTRGKGEFKEGSCPSSGFMRRVKRGRQIEAI